MSSIIRSTLSNTVRRAVQSTRIDATTRFSAFKHVNVTQQHLIQPSRSFASGPVSRVYQVDDDAELRSVLKENLNGLVVVDWTASWCGPCKAIAPYYRELSGLPEFESITFVKADIDEMPDASHEAGVQAVPTFHFIKGGKMVAQLQGANMNKLKELLEEHK